MRLQFGIEKFVASQRQKKCRFDYDGIVMTLHVQFMTANRLELMGQQKTADLKQVNQLTINKGAEFCRRQ